MLIMVEQTQRIGTCNHRLVGVIARGKTAAAAEQAFFWGSRQKDIGCQELLLDYRYFRKRFGVKYWGSYFPVSYLTEILLMCGNKSELSSYWE